MQKSRPENRGFIKLLNYLSDVQKRLIFSYLTKLQFNYCPLILMFCSRTSNNMITIIHEQVLRLILNGQTSDFDTHLLNNNGTCNHHRIIQPLMVDVYKIKNNLNPPIMNFIFERRNNTYNLRNFQEVNKKKKNCKNGS